MEFYTTFLDAEVIICSHTIFTNASTKEFIPVNNATLSYDTVFKLLLYYETVANVY